MFFIPLIWGILSLLGIVVIGGTVFCYRPYCCEDNDYVYYETSGDFSLIDSE